MRRHLLSALALAAVLGAPVAGFAATANVDAQVTFRRAITLNATAALDFSKVDYSNPAVTGSDSVTIDPTTGSATYAGSFAAGAGATTAAGNVNVVTGDAFPVTVECSTTATLANGANTIQVTNIKYDSGAGATACAGIGTSAGSFTLTGGGADNIKLGGKLDGATASGGTIASGAYSTANAGGASIQVDVFYQ